MDYLTLRLDRRGREEWFLELRRVWETDAIKRDSVHQLVSIILFAAIGRNLCGTALDENGYNSFCTGS